VHLIATVVLSAGHVLVSYATGYLAGQKFYVTNPADIVLVKTAMKGIIWDPHLLLGRAGGVVRRRVPAALPREGDRRGGSSRPSSPWRSSRR
jgi:hypothetical protein